MNKLPVPENIPLRWELWRGFGKPELIRTGIVAAIATAVCVVWCVISGSQNSKVISVVIVLAVIFACIAVFSQMEQGLSIYAFFQRQKRFAKEQQLFRYKQKAEVIVFVPEEN